MNTKAVSAVLIDDDDKDLMYAERLDKSSSDLTCVPMKPSGQIDGLVQCIDEMVKDEECDLLLLDYRLDYAESDPAVPYKGGQLAAVIRERIPNLPLVLVTSKDWYNELLLPSPSLHHLFDHIVLKQDLAKRNIRRKIASDLTDLAIGFRRIIEVHPSSWSNIAHLLAVDESELEALSTTDDPPDNIEKIVNWLLKKLLVYPGLLIDQNYAASVLGIDTASFLQQKVQDAIAVHRYEGPFSNWHMRWWHSPLRDWIYFLDIDLVDSKHAERATKIACTIDIPETCIKPAVCNWCGSHEVIRTCINCKNPVDSMHALVAVEDRPYWADRAMVCYNCIQSGHDDGRYYHPGAKSIVEALRTGKLESEIYNG